VTRIAIAAVLGLVLAACQHVEESRIPSNYCTMTRPITWSSGDTRPTKAQIDVHNRTWKRLCASKAPSHPSPASGGG
jgi:pectin methylesterase-like acyl-CoA thioesterase